jgi:peroxiredoxin (alkyl hydroperoxide reductase subunit C)
LIALQTTDRYEVSTPADWQPGDDIIVKSPQTQDEFDKHERSQAKGDIKCLDWYFCYKKL